MSRQFARLMQHRTKRKKGDTAQLAAQLAPLEEQDKAAAAHQVGREAAHVSTRHERGTIVVDTGNLAIPKTVETEGVSVWRIETVVIVIVGIMLAFIAFIAWQISKMP